MVVGQQQVKKNDQKVKEKAGKSGKKYKRQQVVEGIVFVQCSFNNTKVVCTDLLGNVLVTGSAAKSGFKGSRKSTPYAGQVAAESVSKEAMEKYGLRQAHIKVKGPGSGRETSVRAIGAAGIKILSITDVTGIPHNGCRDRKKRRS
jgi:small subunit ribosomal protein S11